jgi:hypothetical protein
MIMTSCSKSDDQKKQSASTLERIAAEALGKISPDEETQEISAMIETAGYVMKDYADFPSQEPGKKSRVLVYTDKKAKSSGGVIYLRKTGYDLRPAWHWYFAEDVPEKVEKVELNDDGLWDVRITLKNGNILEFIQNESFDFTAANRTDWIALNGASSQPIGEGAMWKCFDGDSTTAWQSSTGSGGGAYLEVAAPFGVVYGVLTLHTMDVNQPRQCTLFADGEKLQEFELEPKAASQLIRLDDGVRGAKKIRLTFDSTYGDGDVVAIAEMTLK